MFISGRFVQVSLCMVDYQKTLGILENKTFWDWGGYLKAFYNRSLLGRDWTEFWRNAFTCFSHRIWTYLWSGQVERNQGGGNQARVMAWTKSLGVDKDKPYFGSMSKQTE